jgi:FAD/FMN-containing dehydrogenase
MSTVVIEEFAPLRQRVAGDVVTPGDASWDEARAAWNLAADQRPAAVVIARSADDIVEVVRFARQNGYAVSGQGTGHAAAALASRLESTILIKTH